MLVDSDLKIIDANSRTCKICNFSHENFIGKDCGNLIAPEDRNILSKVFAGMGEDSSWGGKLSGQRKDGEIFPMEITIKRMSFDDRAVFCIIFHDLSEYESLKDHLGQEKAHRREMYITLRNVMNSIEKEKKGMDKLIAYKIETMLLPALEKVRRETSREMQNSYLDIIREQLLGLTSAFPKEIDIGFIKLTRSEMRICQHIQSGYSSKEVADTLNISFETIQTHRKNIRKKLGLHGKKTSLYTFLTTRRKLGHMDKE